MLQGLGLAWNSIQWYQILRCTLWGTKELLNFKCTAKFIVGVCNCSMFCCALLYVHSSIAIILMGKRELIALLNLSSWCLVMVERLFLAVPRGCLQFVIVLFPDHTHYFFYTIRLSICLHSGSAHVVFLVLSEQQVCSQNSLFVCLIWFLTSHQQSFSYIGPGLPGLNQY